MSKTLDNDALSRDAPDDAVIKKTVEDRLYWDRHVNESEIHVRVVDGEIALEGTVPTPQAQEVVVEHAEALPEVNAVENKLTVWNSGRAKDHTDAELARTIHKVLTWNSTMGGTSVVVHVNGGEVTLTGTVESESTRQNIEQRIQKITGVLRVFNQLTVTNIM